MVLVDPSANQGEADNPGLIAVSHAIEMNRTVDH
ncbi:hypothetical protein LMG28614_02445 [Paraburkholderia ultramafica]|uniref:Uncharacterized protein n=1 Tax=Paraburkholderia ultramafica TaxID=1544867 RepID=A0A6S7B4W2_9BURK|nr:hypothetical protein LMG28614_02445 [Paraburkholderia ultramafica]